MDHEGELIIGKFYEELSAVDKKDDVYRVEKILKRKTVRANKIVLVKLHGYDSNHNSSSHESDIQDMA